MKTITLKNLRRAKIVLSPLRRLYAVDEDPMAGVLMLRSWLEGVGGKWAGISDLDDAILDTGNASVAQLLDELRLNVEERQVLALQGHGVRHLGIVAATGLTPRQVERRVASLNEKIRTWVGERT